MSQQPCMWLIKLDCKIRQIGEPKSSAMCLLKNSVANLDFNRSYKSRMSMTWRGLDTHVSTYDGFNLGLWACSVFFHGFRLKNEVKVMDYYGQSMKHF